METNLKLLRVLFQNKDKGTLELSEIMGVAPKNLISKINRLNKYNLVKFKRENTKPKGSKKIYSLTIKGGEYYIHLSALMDLWKIN